jgi:hypothetical protein
MIAILQLQLLTRLLIIHVLLPSSMQLLLHKKESVRDFGVCSHTRTVAEIEPARHHHAPYHQLVLRAVVRRSTSTMVTSVRARVDRHDHICLGRIHRFVRAIEENTQRVVT